MYQSNDHLNRMNEGRRGLKDDIIVLEVSNYFSSMVPHIKVVHHKICFIFNMEWIFLFI